MAEDLIEDGADVNYLDKSGHTLLHYARDPFLVDLLVASGAKVDAVTRNARHHFI